MCYLGVASLGSHKVKNTMPRECIHVISFTRVRNLWHAGLRLAPRLQPAFLRAAAAPFPERTLTSSKKVRLGSASDLVQAVRRTAWKGHWFHSGQTAFSARSPGSRGHDLEDDGQPNRERILAFVCGRRMCKDPGTVEARAQRSPGTSRPREPLAADSG